MSGIAYGLTGDGVKQAFLEAETSVNTYAPPDLIKHSPGVAKVWMLWEQSGAHGMIVYYNMTSICDGTALGDTEWTFATDFSAASFVMVGMGNYYRFIYNSAIAAATATTNTIDHAGTAQDSGENMAAIFGDQ